MFLGFEAHQAGLRAIQAIRESFLLSGVGGGFETRHTLREYEMIYSKKVLSLPRPLTGS